MQENNSDVRVRGQVGVRGPDLRRFTGSNLSLPFKDGGRGMGGGGGGSSFIPGLSWGRGAWQPSLNKESVIGQGGLVGGWLTLGQRMTIMDYRVIIVQEHHGFENPFTEEAEASVWGWKITWEHGDMNIQEHHVEFGSLTILILMFLGRIDNSVSLQKSYTYVPGCNPNKTVFSQCILRGGRAHLWNTV